jgi:FkbM family methyltransferase
VLRRSAQAAADLVVRRTRRGRREVVLPAGPLRGARLVLDFDIPGERAIWLNTYEPWMQRQILAAIREGHLVLDVGAYIGTYALLGRRLGARVVALEPDPDNRERLVRNLEINGETDVVVLPDAVGADEGETMFASAGMHGRTGEGEIAVRTTTLDALAGRFGTPDVVLMDVQGAEADALRGAGGVLSAARTTWLVELHAGGGAEALRELVARGYAVETQDPRADPYALLDRLGRIHCVARPRGAAR